jgi:Asp-tRNA(Asn)/Glu-tRNA(Gln) amidotransferase A subunit family amidase
MRDIADAPLLMGALTPQRDWTRPPPTAPRIALIRGPAWDLAQPETIAAVEEAGRRFARAGANVGDVVPPPALETLRETAWTILCYETNQNLSYERIARLSQVSPPMRKIFEMASKLTIADYRTALTRTLAARAALNALLDGYDAVLTAAAPGEAPPGLAATGDAIFNRAWTAGHLPCVTLPAGTGPKGLPVGIQLVGSQWKDAELLAVARWAAPLLAA